MLLEKPGEIVTREELRQSLWQSETFVDFDQGLNTAMMRLRHALDDAADTPKFIETLPRHGYRFIAPVTFSAGISAANAEKAEAGQVANRMAQDPMSENTRFAGPLKGARWRWNTGGMVAAAVVIAILSLAIGLNLGRLRMLLLHTTPVARVQTLAILPFDSLSNDPAKEFLAESMTEQLITEMGQRRGLRVVSRGSVMQFSGKHLPLEVVAKVLQADDIFEGSIAESGNHLRVTGNLYQVATRKHLWAETYETEIKEGFSPQQDIARDIAHKIETELTPR
jgi:TolB-like protein/DNA-binding winged helix-turn-helix (wHTH) protein